MIVRPLGIIGGPLGSLRCSGGCGGARMRALWSPWAPPGEPCGAFGGPLGVPRNTPHVINVPMGGAT